MKLHPTLGYRECRNTRIKKTNRRVLPAPEYRSDLVTTRMAAEIGRVAKSWNRKTVEHNSGLPAGIGSTLFKIIPWVVSPEKAEKMRRQHIHPRHKRPPAGKPTLR